MSSREWKEVKLGDLLNFRRGHDLPKKNMVPGTVPVVGSNGVIGYHNSFTTKAPCLTIGRSGNVGNPCFINQDCWAHNTTLYVDNYKGNHPLYLFYLLKTLKLSHLSGGSAVPTLNRNHIHPILIRATVNPLEQRAIAATLSCIDDLIELNNRTNQVLEEMAQAIFKHWFVDFEFPNEDGQPYKSSGGAMADSELGEMPAGWRVEKLGKIVSVTSGKRPNIKTDSKTDEFWVPLVGASSIMGYVNDYLYDEPILVIGRVGTHGIIQRFSRPSWPSDNTLVFKSKYYEFTYQILKNIDYKVFNRGSTQPLITQTDMKNFAIILPPTDVIAIFENIIGSLFVLLNNNKIESDKLGYLRDALLPKLMSGEIRVPVEEVV